MSTPAAAQTAPAAQAAPSPEAVDKAQNLFKKGAALFEAKKYSLALEQFRASYATVPSPNSRLYIARCLLGLGEATDAYLEFTRVADEAGARAATEPRYAKTQQTATAERDDLARKLALITVTVSHPETATALLVAGKDVPRDRWGKPYPVAPGSAEVVVRSSAGAPTSQTVTVAAGETKAVTLDASPASGSPATPATEPHDGAGEPPAPHPLIALPPATRQRLRPYAYVAGGVGVAGLAVFTVAGLMANSSYSDLSKTCGGPCPPNRQDDVTAGKTRQTVANVGLVIGALGITAGATLLVLSFSHEPGESQASTSQLVVGPGFMGVNGKF